MTGDDRTGDNGADDELKRRIVRRAEKLDEIDKLKADLADFKAEDKSDGYDEKVLAQVVKDYRDDAEKVLARHLFWAELQTYRRAAGVPTSIEEAEGAAREETETVPAPPASRRGDET